MKGLIGYESKTLFQPTTVVLKVTGVVSMKSIEMYIHHDSSLGGCFAKRSLIASNREVASSTVAAQTTCLMALDP